MKRNQGPASLWEDERVRLVILLLFAVTVFFAKLGLNGMANYDDCFYAEKAKEILQNHDGWILTFNHHSAFENPPFYMWLEALSYKAFGIDTFAAKFPSALMGCASVLLLYFLGRALFNSTFGFLAAFILATTYPFFKYGRHAMVDVTLTFLTIAALYFWLLALRKDSRFFLLWGLCIGLAVLDKSVLGIFPLVISVAYALLTSQGKKMANTYFQLGFLVALGVGCSWYFVEYRQFGHEFLSAHFGWLIFQRGFQGPPEPWYHHFSFLQDLATYYWPWLPLAVFGVYCVVRASFWKNSNLLFITLWPAILILAVSCTQARPLWYFLPAFPALALLSAYALDQWLAPKAKLKLVKGFEMAALLTIFLLNILPFPLDRDREKDTRIIAPYVKHFVEKGARAVALHEDFYGLNNALLFYSDHAAEPLFDNAVQVAKEFESTSPVLCVAHQGDLPEIQKDVREWYPVKYGEDLILIANQKLDTSDVKTWGLLWN